MPDMGAHIPSSAWRGDVRALRLLVARFGSGVPDGSPLSRWLRALTLESKRRLTIENGASDPFSSPKYEFVEKYLVDLYGGRLAAWATRQLLHAEDDGRIGALRIDGNFVTGELCQADDRRPDSFALPAGVATLYLAARCAMHGGTSVSVFGSKSQSLDIEWVSSDGGVVRFEVKTASFQSLLTEKKTPERFGRQVAKRVAEAGLALRRRTAQEQKRWPLQVVSFVSFIPRLEKYSDVVDQPWEELLVEARKGIGPHQIPHVVQLFWWGLGVEDEDFCGRYHHRSVLDEATLPRPPRRAARAFAAAFLEDQSDS